MRKLVTRLAVLALFAVVVGCAISDYTGIEERQTTGEAKLWGKEIGWEVISPEGYTGNYNYTVKYNNHGGVVDTTITSYRNTVLGSFKRDGLVDVDGDDVQGSGGELGGKFLPFFIARDNAYGCQFFDNITYDRSPLGPLVALCYDGPADIEEEIDKDWDIHAAFSDLDHLFKSIWNDQTTTPFALDIAAIRINGQNHYVPQFGIQITHNSFRPKNFTIFDGPGFQAAIQEILNATQNGQPVSFGFVTAGGMTIDLPAGTYAAFNHDGLSQIITSAGTSRKPMAPKLF